MMGKCDIMVSGMGHTDFNNRESKTLASRERCLEPGEKSLNQGKELLKHQEVQGKILILIFVFYNDSRSPPHPSLQRKRH